MTQLDLFKDYIPPIEPTSVVIPFPIRVWGRTEWQHRIVQATNALMSRKTDKGRQGYWTRELDAIAARLRKHEPDEDAIMGELDRFRSAVVEELARRKYGSRKGPGAA